VGDRGEAERAGLVAGGARDVPGYPVHRQGSPRDRVVLGVHEGARNRPRRGEHESDLGGPAGDNIEGFAAHGAVGVVIGHHANAAQVHPRKGESPSPVARSLADCTEEWAHGHDANRRATDRVSVLIQNPAANLGSKIFRLLRFVRPRRRRGQMGQLWDRGEKCPREEHGKSGHHDHGSDEDLYGWPLGRLGRAGCSLRGGTFDGVHRSQPYFRAAGAARLHRRALPKEGVSASLLRRHPPRKAISSSGPRR
jgi:hypothetical protein